MKEIDDSSSTIDKVIHADTEEIQSREEVHNEDNLARKLTARQVQMIAIAGVIGTGLFMGTGKSLAKAGPASMLICYCIVGAIVYLTMLCLGEMATLMPVAGSFCTYAGRYIDPAVGFAIFWNYWANDAVSVASDLTALQLVFEYWDIKIPAWAIALIFWVFLLSLNIITVKAYGEAEYWLALLKIIAIVIFMILGIVVNVGGNTDHEYLGFKYWHLEGAPFVNGFKGFAAIFVTASFAYGGTESIAVTGGETKNPKMIIPRTIRTMFWRILIFYVLTVFFIGINVPYTYPGLSTGEVAVSPFTIVYQEAGSKAAGSFINAVIVTSVISAGNHALYAGTRIMYGLVENGFAPKFFGKLTPNKIPWVCLGITWIISGLCFASSFVGTGTLWTWLQSLVGVSNQISWLVIGITSVRFRRGIKVQQKEHLLTFRNWTYPWDPYVQIVGSIVIILVQGWSSFAPWDTASFFQFYIDLMIFAVLVLGWKIYHRTKFSRAKAMDFETDVYVETEADFQDQKKFHQMPLWRKILTYFV